MFLLFYFKDNLFPSSVDVYDDQQDENTIRPKQTKHHRMSLEDLLKDITAKSEEEKNSLILYGMSDNKRRALDIRKSAIPQSSSDISETWDIDSCIMQTLRIPFMRLSRIVFYARCNASQWNIRNNLNISIPLKRFRDGVNLTESEVKRKLAIIDRREKHRQDHSISSDPVIQDVCSPADSENESHSTPSDSESSSNEQQSMKYPVIQDVCSPADSENESHSTPSDSESSSNEQQSMKYPVNKPDLSRSETLTFPLDDGYASSELGSSEQLWLPIHTFPNYRIASIGISGNLYIMFPCQRKQIGNRFQTIPYAEVFTKFYNLVLLPSFEQIEGLSCRNDLPPVFEITELRNERGQTVDKRVLMLGKDLIQAFELARELVNTSENPDLRMFKGFFFHFEAKGTKNFSKMPICASDTLFDQFSQGLDLDWSYISTDPLQSCFFDVGVEFNPQKNRNLTLLWDGDELYKLMSVEGYGLTIDQYMYSEEIYGIRAAANQKTIDLNPNTPRSFQCYFLDKSPLYVHRDSSASFKKFTSNNILSGNAFWDRKMEAVSETFERMKSQSWGLRYEVRIPFTAFPLNCESISDKVFLLRACSY